MQTKTSCWILPLKHSRSGDLHTIEIESHSSPPAPDFSSKVKVGLGDAKKSGSVGGAIIPRLLRDRLRLLDDKAAGKHNGRRLGSRNRRTIIGIIAPMTHEKIESYPPESSMLAPGLERSSCGSKRDFALAKMMARALVWQLTDDFSSSSREPLNRCNCCCF